MLIMPLRRIQTSQICVSQKWDRVDKIYSSILHKLLQLPKSGISDSFSYMILELSGYLNYNYHCDNILWLWSVLLEDQNKMSSKPGVLGFMSTLLSLWIPSEQQQQQPEGTIDPSSLLHTNNIQAQRGGCWLLASPAFSQRSLSEWQSLYFNISHHGSLGHFRMEHLLPSSHPFISGSSLHH